LDFDLFHFRNHSHSRPGGTLLLVIYADSKSLGAAVADEFSLTIFSERSFAATAISPPDSLRLPLDLRTAWVIVDRIGRSLLTTVTTEPSEPALRLRDSPFGGLACSLRP
jgi:hypothetical protein